MMRVGSAVATAILFGVAALPRPTSAATTPGLAAYIAGHDRTALANLEDELSTGSTDARIPLALGDLYLIRGNLRPARSALEIAAATASEPLATQARIWIAWVEFEAGQQAAAKEILDRIIAADGQPEASDEARLTLGWQQLLRGEYGDAAATFDGFEVVRAGHWLAFPDHALLLEGQAAMWDGQLDRARELLGRVLHDYPTSPVADDAARDLAWCAHLGGDDASAQRQLEAIGSRYRGAHYGTGNVIRTPWTLIATRGPRAMTKSAIRAYRRRPRGQFPLDFLLSIGNRAAAVDARDLLSALAARKSAVASGASPDGSPAEEEQPGIAARPREDSQAGVARSPTPAQPRRSLTFSLLLAAICGLLVVTVHRLVRACREPSRTVSRGT